MKYSNVYLLNPGIYASLFAALIYDLIKSAVRGLVSCQCAVASRTVIYNEIGSRQGVSVLIISGDQNPVLFA